jgi:nitroreductase
MTDFPLLAYQAAHVLRPPLATGETPAIITLPKADLNGGVPLMTALAHRASCRAFAPTALPPTVLGELLWAADGINRPTAGGRTAPSPHAFNEIDIYAALPNGVYRYDAPNHQLVLKHAIDARGQTGYQDFVGEAPLDLIYVVRTSRFLAMPAPQRERFSAVTAGAIAQNVSLYCASAGLASVIRGWINARLLADALSLNEDELPILAQTVGFSVAERASQQ